MKKLICISVAAGMLSGCSMPVASDFNGTVRNTEEQSSESAGKETPAAETAAPEINSATFGDYTLSAPSDWIFDTEEEQVLQNDSRYKAHVLYAYKGRKSKTSPYIALSSFEIVGVGGENFPEAAYENQKLGDYTYDVIYNEYAYSLVTFNEAVRNRSGIVTDPSYCFLMRNDYGSQSITLNYFQHGGPEWNSQEISDIVASLKLARIGELNINSTSNIRYGAGTEELIKDQAHAPGAGYDEQNSKYAVYEIREGEDGPWYRVGDYSWIAQSENTYTPF